MKARDTVAASALAALIATLLSASAVLGQTPVPYAPVWGPVGAPAFPDSTAAGTTRSRSSEYTIATDGSGGAFVAAISGTFGPSQVWLQHLDASGRVARGWPAGGLLLVSLPYVSASRMSLATDDIGGVLVVHQGPFATPPHDSSSTVVWRVRDGDPPVLEWGPRVFSDREVPDRRTLLEPDGQWLQVWTGYLPSGSLAIFTQTFAASGEPAPGSPAQAVIVDSTRCTASACHAIFGQLSTPRRLPDGSIGLLYVSQDPTILVPPRWLHLVRSSRTGQILERGIRELSGHLDVLDSWDVDDQGRPWVMYGDGLEVRLYSLDWSGHERWSSPIRPDSTWHGLGFAPPEIRLRSDGRGGAWTAAFDPPSHGSLDAPLVLQRHHPDQSQLRLSMLPDPGEPWFRGILSSVVLGSDASGNAVLVTGALPTDAYYHHDPESPLPRVQVVSPMGETPPGHPRGVDLPGATRALVAPDGDLLTAFNYHTWDDDPLAVQIQRMHADQPVATLASRVAADWEAGELVLSWQVSGGAATELSVERSLGSDAFAPFALVRPDGAGRLEVRDSSLPSGARARYRLRSPDAVLDTWELVAPGAAVLALDVRGEPGAPMLARVSLIGAGDAQLDVFDVAGRRIESHDLSRHAAGAHEVALEAADAPGLQLVRLREGGAQRLARHIRLR